ncbi:MAG: diguanylate cyclase [Actinobacteria bacterium]|nr:diguanylate cyclase [Actinomycetota bacterium]
MAERPRQASGLGHEPTSQTAFALTRHISRLAAVFDAAPIAVGVWSVDGELLHANPVLCDLVAQPRTELIGQPFESFIDPHDAAGVRDLVRDVWNGVRNYFECDFRCRRPNGTDLWLRTYLIGVYGPSGGPEYFISQIYSFANRRSDRTRSERLSDHAPAMLWVTDDQGVPRDGNPESFRFLGLPEHSGELRRALFETMHPDDFESERPRLVHKIAQREPFDFVARSRRSDGDWRWLHHRAVPVFAAGRSFEGYAGVSFDVSEHEALRRELESVRQLFRSITEAGPIAVLRTDADGNITYANGRWADIIDDPDDRLNRLNWQQVLIPDHVDEIVRRASKSVTTGDPFVMRVRAVDPMVSGLPRLDGRNRPQYWGELRVAPVFTDDGVHDGFVATLTDISNEVAAGSRADRLARVIDAGSDFLMIAERNGGISYVNDAAMETLGVRGANGGDGSFLMDVLDDDSFEFFYEVIEPVLHEAGIWRGELTLRDRNGQYLPVSALVLAQHNDTGHIESISIVARDITDLKAVESRMRYLATHDYLTRLPNRVLLYDHLDKALARYHRHGDAVALFYLDLDEFKPINDDMGHNVGDSVLMVVADRIHTVVRDTDTAARIGGDEFAVLIQGVGDQPTLAQLASRLIETIGQPIELEDEIVVRVGVSIGAVIASASCAEGDALMAMADSAMYRAKSAGRGRYEFVVATKGGPGAASGFETSNDD